MRRVNAAEKPFNQIAILERMTINVALTGTVINSSTSLMSCTCPASWVYSTASTNERLSAAVCSRLLALPESSCSIRRHHVIARKIVRINPAPS